MSSNKIIKTKKSGDNMEKYLTEMKELPLAQDEEPQAKLVEKPAPEKEPDVKNDVKSKPIEPPVASEKPEKTDKKKTMKEVRSNTEVNGKPYSVRDVVLGVVNVVAIALLFFILTKIPAKVEEYKKLNLEIQKYSEKPEVGRFQIEQNKEKYEKLNSAFLIETKIVNFVNAIEEIKTEGSSISKITFTNESAVKDKTGNLGYPLIIDLTGTWEAISLDLEKIDRLPYLFRVVRVESEKLVDNVILLKYGGVLYVEDTGKN
ncbi:MAG: hypothetical protein US62_C0007G0013 [Candidatus Woesebacteria bacterium GW2011_GWA1_37_8]|uniref:Uncharacterized protein n=2 Tax=Candidatus Woeseibacteriota TaxID=1752722 RepID=A0A0G0LH52_9BACT|nr:MAG: hypothetical protein US62_C0007G0013 [Candidatus Woesebacteria bacterium GW2011_GWA1_37_8]KKQ87250.1 MAG: hypothetical protein UT10_C0008G0011 [Candidatus Woesebacteria bacterium GW2011_GWB1_38_8b]